MQNFVLELSSYKHSRLLWYSILDCSLNPIVNEFHGVWNIRIEWQVEGGKRLVYNTTGTDQWMFEDFVEIGLIIYQYEEIIMRM